MTSQTIDGELTGKAAYVDPKNPVAVNFDGSGNLMASEAVTNHGVANLTGPAPSCPGGFLNTHDETFTDAQGNTLTIRMNDLACPEGDKKFHGHGTWTVTGGTGCYNGATGSGTADGHVDFSAGTFQIHLTGKVETT